MRIGTREIGPDQSPYMIAELSGNHNGDINNVYRLIDNAYFNGADAVKLQCYTPDTITMKSDRDDFLIKDGPWKGRTLYDLYREAHTPPEWFERIFDYARSVRKIEVFASVFDETAIDLLQRLNVSAYKIASFELTDLPLIQATAETDRPIILSTGMGGSQEIRDALNTINRFSANPDVALLHCISAYPASASQSNLPRLGQLSSLLGGRHVVGISDHTLGVGVSAAAIAFGACIVEKHLCLSRSAGGPDSHFSLEPMEFGALVTACREAWEATRPSSSPSQAANLQFRRSIYVTAPVSAGEKLSKENIRVIRPAFGLAPKFYPSVLGRMAKMHLEPGTPLSLDCLVSSDE
jgi:N-acetylneuraminate synthase